MEGTVKCCICLCKGTPTGTEEEAAGMDYQMVAFILPKKYSSLLKECNNTDTVLKEEESMLSCTR